MQLRQCDMTGVYERFPPDMAVSPDQLAKVVIRLKRKLGAVWRNKASPQS